MISDVSIQLFLRNMLLDGLEAKELTIPVLYEGTTKVNKANTFIVEQLIPQTEETLCSHAESGKGIYKVTIFANNGNGLQITDISDKIRSIFVKGTYVVSDSENIKLVIGDIIPSSIIYEKSTDKMQKSVSISYIKHKSA